MARMLISPRKKENVNFDAMHKLKSINFMSTCDSKDVDFTKKTAKCQFHTRHKLKSVDFSSKEVKMLISRQRVMVRMLISLRKQKNVNFTQCISSKIFQVKKGKMLISG